MFSILRAPQRAGCQVGGGGRGQEQKKLPQAWGTVLGCRGPVNCFSCLPLSPGVPPCCWPPGWPPGCCESCSCGPPGCVFALLSSFVCVFVRPLPLLSLSWLLPPPLFSSPSPSPPPSPPFAAAPFLSLSLSPSRCCRRLSPSSGIDGTTTISDFPQLLSKSAKKKNLVLFVKRTCLET